MSKEKRLEEMTLVFAVPVKNTKNVTVLDHLLLGLDAVKPRRV